MKFQITFFRNQEMYFVLVLCFYTCGSRVQVPDLEVRWILLLKIEVERVIDRQIYLQDYKEFLAQSILQSQVYKEDRPESQRASHFQVFGSSKFHLVFHAIRKRVVFNFYGTSDDYNFVTDDKT